MKREKQGVYNISFLEETDDETFALVILFDKNNEIEYGILKKDTINRSKNLRVIYVGDSYDTAMDMFLDYVEQFKLTKKG